MFQLGHAKQDPCLFPAPAALQRRVFPFLIWPSQLFFQLQSFHQGIAKVRYFAFNPQTLPPFDYVPPLINLASTVLLSKTFGGHFINPLKSYGVLQYDSLEIAVHVVAH